MSTLEDQPVEAAEPTPQSQGPEAAAPEDSKPSEGDEVKPKVSETEEVAEAEPQEPAPDEGQEPPEVEERSPSSEPKPPPKEKGRLDIEVDMLHEGKVLSLPNSEGKIKAREVIDKAHSEADTEEKDFFSVYYYDDYKLAKDDEPLPQKIFLYPNKSLKRQMYPPEKRNSPIMLTYGVKYYIPDPAKLREDYSRFLYCVQLCEDIRKNSVRVDRETAIRLTALMLQATIGDYDAEEHKTEYIKNWPNFELLPESLQPDNYTDQIIEVHKAKTGYTPAQAELEFLSLAKDLPRYGQHLFLAKDRDGTPVMLGNGCRGIALYRDFNSDQERSQLIEWKDIVKISYKRHRFRIEFHPTENANETTRVETNKFYTGEVPQAKRIWKNAVEQHAFFRLSVPEPPTLLERIQRRTSFRFTGSTWRQSMRRELKRDNTDFPRRTMSQRAASKGRRKKPESYVVLDRPPAGNALDLDKFERQKVVVDFRLAESADDQAQRYVLRKDQHGSYQMLDRISFDDEKEPNFHLTEVDEESKAALVTVTLNVEAPASAADSHAHDQQTDLPVFDSRRMPVVKVGGVARVTTTSVVESDGKPVTSGRHSQRYPLEEVADVEQSQSKATYDFLAPADEAETIGPAVEGSEEAKQVDLFLEREDSLMKQVLDVGSTPTEDPPTGDPPALEVEVEIGD